VFADCDGGLTLEESVEWTVKRRVFVMLLLVVEGVDQEGG